MTLVILATILAVAMVATTLLRGQGRRLLLPSGSEWLFVGVLAGPVGAGLVARATWLSAEPVIDFLVGWLGMMLGMFFGGVQHKESARIRLLGALASVGSAAAMFAALHVVLVDRMGPGQGFTMAMVLAGCGASGSRIALRWLQRYRRPDEVTGPASRVLAAQAQWDNLLSILVVALWHAMPDGDFARGHWTELGTVVASGIVCGALGAALLGRKFTRESAWGTLLGVALLATGISIRLGQVPAVSLFFLGFVLVRASPQRRVLRRLVSPTEAPAIVVLLTTAGALVDLSLLAKWWWVVVAFILIRVAARTTFGMVHALSGVRRGGRLGLGSLSIGCMSVALALDLRMFDHALELPVSVLVVSMAISEVFARLKHRVLVDLDGLSRAKVVPGGDPVSAGGEPRTLVPDPSGPIELAVNNEIEPRSPRLTLGRALALGLLYGALYLVVQLAPQAQGFGPVLAGFGFLILAGTLAGQVIEVVGLPRLTGQLLAGLIAGPHVLALVDQGTVADLALVNGLALALLALEAGGHLTLEAVQKDLRTLTYGTVVQIAVVTAATAGLFVAIAPMIPFVRDLPFLAQLGVGLLWGMIAVSRSPAAALAVLTETRAAGPVARISLGTIVVIEVGLLSVVALVLPLSRGLIDPGAALSFDDVAIVGHEVMGSIAVGTALGMLLGVSMKAFRQQLLLFLIVVGFSVYEIALHLDFDPLLVFLVAGVVVRNITGSGLRMLASLERASVIIIIFFANAGAALQVPSIKALLPAVLLLAGGRILAMAGSSWTASKLAGDPPEVRRWVWSGFISQGAMGYGIALMVKRAYPQFGSEFETLVLAVIGVNLFVGPILYKIALTRSGEVGRGRGVGHGDH